MFIILSVPAFNIYIYLHGEKKKKKTTNNFFFKQFNSNTMRSVSKGNKDTHNCTGGQQENKTRPLSCKALAQQCKPSQSVADI